MSKQSEQYAKGYADAMNWKVQNHLEHLPTAQPEFDYKEHAEGLQRDYDLLLAEYNDLKAKSNFTMSQKDFENDKYA